jgi:predicted enzyme related to lactoylglutathione lyase
MDKHHTITHIEIPAPDLQKAIDFYSSVFKWETEVVQEGVYAFFRIGDTNSGGGFDTSLVPAQEKYGVQIVIDVNDINETLQLIREHGGTIIMQKTEIGGGHGYYAGFVDPNGNSMQIHSRN